MRLKFYAVFGLLLFSIVFEDHTVGGQQQENDKVDSNAIGHRRVPRSLLLVKTAVVAGAIGIIAGLIIGHKKSREKNHIQSWGHHHHYRRRSISDSSNETGSVTSKYDDAELLRAAKILDQLGCGGRLVCELHQQRKEDLNETGVIKTSVCRRLLYWDSA
ncbi:hypothetical protein DAPPUDRAFT_107952 [Daphnia pulex]|uniref:Uncharacterized protein n=1 Tax=Daphnia pulex TaxID=6669 RepID=E9GYP2_DAPPU|nr:hypothetical protein DAPPUDRAFT_107952 [Daphnia pulex]|eukprot:EFX75454.1 hypothetical protein DAPPUDRAFT_107952 [Daphnia pulex]